MSSFSNSYWGARLWYGEDPPSIATDTPESYYSNSYWGSSYYYGGDYRPITLTNRLLQFIRRGDLATLVRVRAERTERILEAAAALSVLFGVDRSGGVIQDRLGEILQVERLGSSDYEYRKRLRIQARVVVASAGTTSMLLEVVSLFTERGAIEYTELFPAHILVGVITDRREILSDILQSAKPGGVLLQLAVSSSPDVLLCDRVSGGVANSGTVDTVGGGEATRAFRLITLTRTL